ncbi:MAG: hypothetical protein FWH33_09660 [Oscillospiraceae bacterium]|nr:hypothetical protein [Oscillospiraceae bacterium]
MKQRISINDVTSLTFSQQEKLRSIWTPDRYDIAVSRLCVNAESDEYKWLEFAIGDIVVHRNGDVILKDLRLTDGFVKIIEGEGHDDDEFELQEPTAFLKSESLPLLTIGQMMTMLHMLDKERYHFYLLSGNDKYACEIGDFNSSLKPQLLRRHEKVDEIADVLWTTLRVIL